MGMWFLAAAAVLLAVALVLAHFQDQRRANANERAITNLRGDFATLKQNCKHRADEALERHREQLQTNAHLGKGGQALAKEQEILSIRQRTLEKRIISAERVVTVNVNGLQPEPKMPAGKTRGAGRGALIPENRA